MKSTILELIINHVKKLFSKKIYQVHLIEGSEIPPLDEYPDIEFVIRNKLKSFKESRYEFDKKNELGQLQFTLFSEYDFNGNKITSGYFNSIGNHGFKWCRKYNIMNKLTELSYYSLIDNLILKYEISKYNDLGLLIEVATYVNLKNKSNLSKESFNLEGTDLYFDSKILYYYDDNSNIIEEFEIMHNGEIYTKTKYSYDKNSNLIEKIINNYRHFQYEKYFYEFQNDKLIRENQYYLKEFKIQELNILYNKNGLKIESQELINNYSDGFFSFKIIEYKYDIKNVLRERNRKKYIIEEDELISWNKGQELFKKHNLAHNEDFFIKSVVKNNPVSKIELNDLICKNNLIKCTLPRGFNNSFESKNLEYDDNGNIVRSRYYNLEGVLFDESYYTYPKIIYDSIKKFDKNNNCILEEGFSKNWTTNSCFELELLNQRYIKREFEYY